MLVPGSDAKDFLSVMFYWNMVRMARFQVMKSAQWIRAVVMTFLLSASSEEYVHMLLAI